MHRLEQLQQQQNIDKLYMVWPSLFLTRWHALLLDSIPSSIFNVKRKQNSNNTQSESRSTRHECPQLDFPAPVPIPIGPIPSVFQKWNKSVCVSTTQKGNGHEIRARINNSSWKCPSTSNACRKCPHTSNPKFSYNRRAASFPAVTVKVAKIAREGNSPERINSIADCINARPTPRRWNVRRTRKPCTSILCANLTR